MGENSKIEWTHHTFNPWWGCVKVSDGCKHCYADTVSRRYGFDVWGANKPRRFFGDKHWREPIRWNREAAQAGERRRVFCASMADWAETHRDPEIQHKMNLYRDALASVVNETTWLDWLFLTKRIQDADAYLCEMFGETLPANLWLGTSVENQQTADERIPHLLRVPAAVRFLSCEPLLGPVDLTDSPIDWVIVGGESGPAARPMHPDWARSLRDQCNEAGAAFHFKQWGEWLPFSDWFARTGDEDRHAIVECDGMNMVRVGKRAAGRLLDGQMYDEFPKRCKRDRAASSKPR